MNIPITHAAEGLERRAFALSDVLRIVEIGVLGHDERFELIGGEIVPLSPKNIGHERLRVWLNTYLIRNRVAGTEVARTTLYLSDDTFVESDFVLYSKSDGLAKLDGKSVKLAIEVSASSLDYDLGRKARLYAEFGVCELWVIDAKKLVTRTHCQPFNGEYGDVDDLEAGRTLTPKFLPGPSVNLKDFS